MKHVTNQIKGIQKKGKLLHYKDTDSSSGVTNYFCSTHIKKQKMLVKGEYGNPQCKSRKALLVFFDSKTGEVKGGCIVEI